MFGVKLSHQELKFFTQHTECSARDVRELHQDFVNKSPEGKMTKPQFLKFYTSFFPAAKDSRENCDHVFRTFDTDHNGHITFKEFLFAMNLLSTGTPRQKLSLLFHMFDVNGDGVIGIDELTTIVESIFKLLTVNIAPLAKFYVDSPAQRAKKIFKKLDNNKDNKITMEEFVSGCICDLALLRLLTANTCSLVMKDTDHE